MTTIVYIAIARHIESPAGVDADYIVSATATSEERAKEKIREVCKMEWDAVMADLMADEPDEDPEEGFEDWFENFLIDIRTDTLD